MASLKHASVFYFLLFSRIPSTLSNTAKLLINACRWTFFFFFFLGLPWWLSWSRIHLQCGRPGFDPWVATMLWRREKLPLQYSGLENSMVHGVAKSWTRLSNFHFTCRWLFSIQIRKKAALQSVKIQGGSSAVLSNECSEFSWWKPSSLSKQSRLPTSAQLVPDFSPIAQSPLGTVPVLPTQRTTVPPQALWNLWQPPHPTPKMQNVLPPEIHRAYSLTSLSGFCWKTSFSVRSYLLTPFEITPPIPRMCFSFLHITNHHWKHSLVFLFIICLPHHNGSVPRAGTVVFSSLLYAPAHSRYSVNIYWLH